MTVAGTDNTGKSVIQILRVFRFGVQCEDGTSARVVGLADQQAHTIQAWMPNYTVHSRPGFPDIGAWIVMPGKGFLIHAGPEDPNRGLPFATIGCTEIIGPQGFVKFNDLLISLIDPPGGSRGQKLAAIGSSGCLRIIYQRAARPPLKKAR
jgi:hypothetical protein